MGRLFNIAGPCFKQEHYMLSTMERTPEIVGLFESKQYFVIHAARQSGKTSLLNAIEQDLNKKGDYAVLYCSLETVQGLNDPSEGIPAIIY